MAQEIARRGAPRRIGLSAAMRALAPIALLVAIVLAASHNRAYIAQLGRRLKSLAPEKAMRIFGISAGDASTSHTPLRKMTGAAPGACAHKHASDDAFLDRDVLPANVTPAHYDLHILPDMQAFTFTGTVDIKVTVHEATNTVQLNAKELSVATASVAQKGAVHDAATAIDDGREVLTLTLPQKLLPGEATVSIAFSGTINDKMAGFYRSQYAGADGRPRVMGATQFESTDARQAFPCWDEPARKATFSVSITAPKDLVVLGNMDVAGEDGAAHGQRTVRFARTPVMSTYLVAWVIGELDSVHAKTKAGVDVRVWAPLGQAEKQGRFALDVGTRTLDFFSDYFGIAYPLPKMDMVAIPDFSAGAMENWGLVTYRTAALLFDEASSSLKTKQYVAYVVGHELAHQWFGNLVTMEWWSDLWLNEGFATWVGWRAAHELFPEWDIWTEFVVDDVQAGLRLDALRSSHAIEVPVRDPAAISQIFDSISYSKGASVIRMLVAHLGEDVFVRGLQAYLRKHAYANARTSDLWDALAKASGRPVNAIMEGWTRHVGYPVVSVSADSATSLAVAQSRFLASGLPAPGEDDVTWHVPLCLSTEKSCDRILSTRTASVSVPGDAAYVKVNADTTGFYRVHYTPELLRRIGSAVASRHSSISAADRVGLVSDAFAMSVAGRLPLTAALDLLSSFRGETDYLVWSEISSQLLGVLSAWWEEPEDVRTLLNEYVRGLFSPQARALGFEPRAGESDKTKLLRPLVLSMAGRVGDADVVAEARRRLEAFAAGDDAALDPNVRSAAYGAALRNGGMPEYERVLGLYRRLTVADQRLAALGALGSTGDRRAVDAVLRLTLSDADVRPQDVIYVTRATGANPVGRRATWAFVKEHWPFFHGRYGLGGGISLLGRVVSTSCHDLTSEADAADVEAFFRDKDTAPYVRSLQQSLERIRLNAAWLCANRAAVATWLRALAK